MAKITTIGDLSLVKSAMLIGKTGPRFRCLHIAAISFTLPAAKCRGALLDTNSAASLKASDFDIRFPDWHTPSVCKWKSTLCNEIHFYEAKTKKALSRENSRKVNERFPLSGDILVWKINLVSVLVFNGIILFYFSFVNNYSFSFIFQIIFTSVSILVLVLTFVINTSSSSHMHNNICITVQYGFL